MFVDNETIVKIIHIFVANFNKINSYNLSSLSRDLLKVIQHAKEPTP